MLSFGTVREEKEKQRVEERPLLEGGGGKEKEMKEKQERREGAYVTRGDPLPTLPSSPSRTRRRAAPLCILHRRKLGSLHSILPRLTEVLCSQANTQP